MKQRNSNELNECCAASTNHTNDGFGGRKFDFRLV